jgi:hypothetical protein
VLRLRARHGIEWAAVETGQVGAEINVGTNDKSSATQADRRGMFQCKPEGIGCGAEGPRALRGSGFPVTAEVKLGGS